jgi:hypothetical protein
VTALQRNEQNTIELVRVTLLLQRFPGTGGTDAERGIEGLEFRALLGEEVLQAGRTAVDGSIVVDLPPGTTHFTLELFGDTYDVEVDPTLDDLRPIPNMLRGATYGDAIPELLPVSERLQMLGTGVRFDDEFPHDGYERALLGFQSDAGLVADGLIGPNTAAALGRVS